jgi:hypothetical protein
MNVHAVSRRKEITYMKTFTIDTEDNISAFATPEEAAATTATPFDTFASQKELFGLVGKWPAERLVALWNCVPGVRPVKTFKGAKVAASRVEVGREHWAARGKQDGAVVAMLKRKDGATLQEIMQQMGWQKHTVRGFMAGAGFRSYWEFIRKRWGSRYVISHQGGISRSAEVVRSDEHIICIRTYSARSSGRECRR